MSDRSAEIVDLKWAKQLKMLGLTRAEYLKLDADREAKDAECKRTAIHRACSRIGISFGLEWKSESEFWTIDQARGFFHMRVVAFFEQWLHTGAVPHTKLIDQRLTQRLRESGNGPGLRAWDMDPIWDGAWMLLSGAELHGWAHAGISSIEMSMTFAEKDVADPAESADGPVNAFLPCVLSINWWARRGEHEMMQPVVDAFRSFLEQSLADVASIDTEEDDFSDDIGLYGLLYDALNRACEMISDQDGEIARLNKLLQERDSEFERYQQRRQLRVHSPGDLE